MYRGEPNTVSQMLAGTAVEFDAWSDGGWSDGFAETDDIYENGTGYFRHVTKTKSSLFL